MIPACSGKRIEVKQGQTITVIDTEGGQVADFFAEITGNDREFLSPGVTIDCNESLRLRVGDTIYTNLYRPISGILAAPVMTGQNKAIRDRIFHMNSLMINCERRGTA